MAEEKITKKKVAKKEDTPKKETTKEKTTPVKTEKKEIKDSKAKAPKKETKVKKEEKKVEVKKKFIPKVKKNKIKKSDEAYETQKTLKGKKKLPTFRGRFGKKNIRRKSKVKWQKWRKPRSIDLDRGLQHGFRPKIGYRNKAELRDIHPSGYREVVINNVSDLEAMDIKTEAARISATVGKRKRNDIVTKANEKGIWILN